MPTTDPSSANQGYPEIVVPFDDVVVEVRSDADPYTVITGVKPDEDIDLSIFFWLSCLCMLIALILIFYLIYFFSKYIATDD